MRYMKKLGVVIMASLPMSAFAVLTPPTDVLDEVGYKVEVQQLLAIDSPGDLTATAQSVSQTVQWTVTSNNGVRISFDGDSFTDAGLALAQPVYVKEDMDASATGKGTYDSLDTSFGVLIAGHDSVETATTWEGGSTPTGTPANLILALGATGSPDKAIGRIMSDDDASTFTVDVYGKGVKDANDQSGNYIVTLEITATASAV